MDADKGFINSACCQSLTNWLINLMCLKARAWQALVSCGTSSLLQLGNPSHHRLARHRHLSSFLALNSQCCAWFHPNFPLFSSTFFNDKSGCACDITTKHGLYSICMRHLNASASQSGVTGAVNWKHQELVPARCDSLDLHLKLA